MATNFPEIWSSRGTRSYCHSCLWYNREVCVDNLQNSTTKKQLHLTLKALKYLALYRRNFCRIIHFLGYKLTHLRSIIAHHWRHIKGSARAWNSLYIFHAIIWCLETILQSLSALHGHYKTTRPTIGVGMVKDVSYFVAEFVEAVM